MEWDNLKKLSHPKVNVFRGAALKDKFWTLVGPGASETHQKASLKTLVEEKTRFCQDVKRKSCKTIISS